MSEQKKGILQMITCAVLWSTAGVLIKLIPWHGMAIAGFRSLVAAVVVAAYLVYAKQKWVCNRRTLCIAVVMCATYICFSMANKLTTAANAIVLQFTAPVYLLLYGALFEKKRLHAMDVGVVALTLGGIALFFFDQLSPGTLLGNCVALLSGLFFACTFVCNGGVDFETRINGILQGQFLTALVGVPFLFFTDAPPVTGTMVAAILALGVFQLGIPYVLFGLALKRCSPLSCTLLSALEPLLNPVWVAVFTGEAPGVWALIGGGTVVAAITCWCVWDAKYRPPAPTAEKVYE